MIRLALVLSLLAGPAFAVSTERAVERYERGQIMDFLSNPYKERGPWGEVDALSFIDQRIWDGERWIPLATRRGANFFIRFEREKRDGRRPSSN